MREQETFSIQDDKLVTAPGKLHPNLSFIRQIFMAVAQLLAANFK